MAFAARRFMMRGCLPGYTCIPLSIEQDVISSRPMSVSWSKSNSSSSSLSTQQRWMGHSVKIVLKEDMPNGKGFAGEIVTVKAGYARNYLVPQKIAFYATEDNIAKYANLAATAEASQVKDEEVKDSSNERKAYDLLRKYLKLKELTIYRKADKTGRCHPGVVTANNVRQKLSKHLKIDLEDHEVLRLEPTSIAYDELLAKVETSGNQDVGPLDSLITEDDMGRNLSEVKPCTTEIKQVGEYCAKIYLDGGFCVPLFVRVVRKP